MLKVLIPKEMGAETRVAGSPDTVRALAKRQLLCVVEKGAGTASGFSDEQYSAAGAELASPQDSAVWAEANLLLTVGPLQLEQPKTAKVVIKTPLEQKSLVKSNAPDLLKYW